MDLINREDAIKVIHQFFKEKIDAIYGNRDEVAAGEIDGVLKDNKELSGKIKDIPTVEAVPVVRCKNCEQWGKTHVAGETDRVKMCEYGKYMVGENGYCCYGADTRKKVQE